MTHLASEMDATDLNTQLERWIELKTSGRIHYLRVESSAGRVIVHGHAGSHYVRQLALAAVLDVLKPTQGQQVELDIDVGPAAPMKPRRPIATERYSALVGA